MKGLFIVMLVAGLTMMSCSKNKEPECEVWNVLYWQGKGNHVTVTSNYQPYSKDLAVCGDDKKNASQGNIVIIKNVGGDLYDYMTYQAKR